MAARKPLVIIDGIVQQLPSGDSLDAYTLDIDIFTAENGESSASLEAGMASYVSAADNVMRAQANALSTARVVGLARETIAAGSTGPIQTDGVLTLADWSSVTEEGQATLTAGSYYWLSPDHPGLITLTAPTTPGEVVVHIGVAINTTSLEISIDRPILL